MPDILLIQPPIQDFYLTRKRTVPYGLAMIAAVLTKQGYSVEIFDGLATNKSRIIPLPGEMDYLKPYYGRIDRSEISLFHHYKHFGYSFQHIAAQAKASKAFLIGISAMFTPYAAVAIRLAEEIKHVYPECQIVLGGHHPTALPELVLDSPAVDFVLRGEGEVSMPLLADAIRKGADLEKVPGLVMRKQDGELVVNEPVLADKLDALPLPALHLIKQKYYQRKGAAGAVIMSSRGCPMKCAYCSVSATSFMNYRQCSIESIIEEMDQAVFGFGARFIDFEDENLSFRRDWFLEFLNTVTERYRDYDLELRAMNGLLPTTLDESNIPLMKKAGFKTLNLSLCSISKENLKRYLRPNVTKAFERTLTLADQNGLESNGYIIVGGPEQDPSVSVEDLLYLAGKKVLAGVSVYYPSPGSTTYRLCQERGLLPDHLSLTRSTALPLSDKTTRLESLTLLRLGRLLNFMKSIQDNKKIDPGFDPGESGKRILEAFWEKAEILGIDDQDNTYPHFVATDLVRQFRDGVRKISLQGVKTSFGE